MEPWPRIGIFTPAAMPHVGRSWFVLSLALVAGDVSAADEAATAKPRRAISPHVARMLADATNKLAPAAQPDPPPAAEASVGADRPTLAPSEPANRIVRLPPYLVSAPKLPTPEEVMTETELTKFAMRKYLGDEQDLDRALSMITPAHLWRKIPILGRFPFVGFETNEQRALRIYREEKQKEEFANLMGLQALGTAAEAKPAPKK